MKYILIQSTEEGVSNKNTLHCYFELRCISYQIIKTWLQNTKINDFQGSKIIADANIINLKVIGSI